MLENENIDKQKLNLFKWKHDFLENLSKNEIINIDLFLAEEEWLIKYINSIIGNTQKKSDIIYDIYDKIELKNKFELNPMDNYPRVLILNKNCYTSLSDNLTKKFVNRNGTFYNKLLLIDMKKSNTYCIFFLDAKGNMRQGYLQIIKSEDNEIINKFKKEEPLNLLKELKIEISDYLIFGKIENKFYLKIFNINNNFFKLDFKHNNSINPKTTIIPNSEYEKKNNNGLDVIQESEENKAKTFIIKKLNKRENKIKNIIYQNEVPKPNIFINKKNEEGKINIIKSYKSNYEISNMFRPKKSIIKKNPSQKIAITRNRNFGIKLNEFLPNKSFHKEISLTPGLIGLEKSKGFIFLNAVLQSFSNIGRLRIHLLNQNIYEDLENNQRTNKKLSYALAEVLFNIWKKSDRRFFSPNNIKNIIYSYNPVFIKGPKDLFLFLLDNIHNELNDLQNKLDSLNNIKFEINNAYLNTLYNNYLNDFFNKNCSIIVNEFYGFLATEYICQCSNVSYKFKEMKIISLNLEEMGKYINKKDINISDCFKFYTRKENNIQEICENCNNNFQSKEIKIMNTPKTLLISFDRKDNIEGNIKINFGEYLDIKEYIFNSKSNYYYELKGIICKDEKGNFIAYCKNSDNCEWYKYNDDSVTKVYFYEVKGARLPYVLFYNYISA